MTSAVVNDKTEKLGLECSEATIHIARNKSEKREIYRFRHQVYVEEMAKPIIAGDDHDKGILYDSLDDKSLLLYAQNGSGIIGTLRLTFGKAADFPLGLSKIFFMEKFESLFTESTNYQFCLSTKLAVKENYRGSQILYMLLAEAYRQARDHNAKINFGGGNLYRIPLYEQIGYRRFTRNFVDPGYRLIVPLAMLLEDIEYFRSVRSPFSRIASRWINDQHIGEKFLRLFPETLSHINSQLINKVDLWRVITQKFGKSPTDEVPILRGLSEKEASTLLHFGAVVHCTLDECIVDYGEVSNEIFILLSGSVLGETKKQIRIIRPGQIFGGIGIIAPKPQKEKITAITDAEILVISRQYFEKFKRLHSNAHLQLMQNINAVLKDLKEE